MHNLNVNTNYVELYWLVNRNMDKLPLAFTLLMTNNSFYPDIYLAHAYNAYSECNVFSYCPSSCSQQGVGRVSGREHYLANVPGHEHFLAKDPHPHPPPPDISTIWLMSQGMSTFWLRTTHPPPLPPSRYGLPARGMQSIFELPSCFVM